MHIPYSFPPAVDRTKRLAFQKTVTNRGLYDVRNMIEQKFMPTQQVRISVFIRKIIHKYIQKRIRQIDDKMDSK